jgi:hypothetical protein
MHEVLGLITNIAIKPSKILNYRTMTFSAFNRHIQTYHYLGKSSRHYHNARDFITYFFTCICDLSAYWLHVDSELHGAQCV